MNKRKTILGIAAGMAIFFGFGMIHVGKPTIETTGSALIGVGSLYFLVVLFCSLKGGKDTEEQEQSKG